MYHLLANVRTGSQVANLQITQGCWGRQLHFSKDLLLVSESKVSLVRFRTQTCEWGPQFLVPQAAHWKDLLIDFLHLAQRVFAWTGWQGRRRHMGCNDLEKRQAGGVLQLHLLRKCSVPGEVLSTSHMD